MVRKCKDLELNVKARKLKKSVQDEKNKKEEIVTSEFIMEFK